jgi:hypothetical protein
LARNLRGKRNTFDPIALWVGAMSRIRKAAEAAFILLMAAGAMLALYAVNQAVNDYLDVMVRYGSRGLAVNGARMIAIGGTGAAELAATVAFATVYIRRGSDILAPVVFMWTYAAVGAASALLLLWAARHAQRADAVWFVPMFLAVAILICAPGLAWIHRSARKS